MDCERAREAISALVDDEEPGVDTARLHDHVTRCAGCAAWEEAVLAVPRPAMGAAGSPGEHVLPAVLHAMAADRAAQRAEEEDRKLRPWRVALVFVAVIQPALVLSSLLSEHWLHHTHAGRELGAWHVALAVGFLFAALRPARAWGMLPLVAAIVAGLVLTAGVDLADGEVVISEELAHAVDLVGLGCLWALSARVHRPAGRLRTA